jgi:hypothetical protein
MEEPRDKVDSLRIQSAEHIITSDSAKLEVRSIRIFVERHLFWIIGLVLFTLVLRTNDLLSERLTLNRFFITQIADAIACYLGYRAFTKVRELKKF